MSTISPVSAGATATADPSPPVPAAKTLGQDDFLKLLAQQFQAQDPLSPMQDTSFIAQMAQFTSLQQSSAMATDLSAMRAEQQYATANSYLGRQVVLDTSDGGTASGIVTGVETVSGAPRLVVGDFTYPVSAVLLVQPAPAAPGSSTTP